MKIMQLTKDDIPLVTEGATPALAEELEKELERAELYGHVIYVRYSTGWLQRLSVAKHILEEPGVIDNIEDHRTWLGRYETSMRLWG